MNLINIIKTAIITIIISFASGLMLDYFTNLAPRILCNVRNGIPLELNSKKVCAYIITVNNTSNKTIHELALNIQSSQTNLKSTNATITTGLKFDSSIKDNNLDVYIPFLSKGDEFSVTVYVENQYAVNDKPVIVIRSPENFKEIDSVEHKGILSLLFNIPKNINQVILQIMKKSDAITSTKKDDFTTVMNKAVGAEQTTNKKSRELLHGNRKPNTNKKVLITIASIILIMIAGVLGKFYLNGMSTSATTPIVNTTVPKQSTGVAGSSGQATGNTNTTSPRVRNAKNTGTTGSAERTTGTNSKTGSKAETTGTTAPTSGTTGTTGSKTETTKTAGSTGSAAGTTDTTGSKAGTTGATGSSAGTTGTGTTESKTGTAGN